MLNSREKEIELKSLLRMIRRGGGSAWIVGILLLLTGTASGAEKPVVDNFKSYFKLCPNFLLSEELRPSISDAEKRVICGDPEAKSDVWQNIPAAQGRHQLKVYLQDRGFHHPKFSKNEDGTINYVKLGPPTRVSKVLVEGAPKNFNYERRRNIVGELLTPALLQTLEKWLTERLQAEGYACPKVKSEANADLGEVHVTLDAGEVLTLASIQEEEIEGLEPQVLRRFDAFRIGERYNRDLLLLTENRVTEDRVLQSIHFASHCEKDGVHAKQERVEGPPRILSFGAGINTEGVLLGQASWQNVRVGGFASSMTLGLKASAREQIGTATAKWYFHNYPSRVFLRPLLEIRHDSEIAFEIGSIRAQMALASTADDQARGFSFSFGPSQEFVRTIRGSGPSNSMFTSLEGEIGMKSHDFEFNQTSPRSGYKVNAQLKMSDRALLSSVSGQRFRLGAEGLWNLNNYDPPLLIFGLRGALASTLTAERPGPETLLPPTLLDYLGGSATLRGFNRQELPFTGFGSLSSIFLDSEIRLSPWPGGLEPFIFGDFGLLGSVPLQLEGPLYFSPGFGLRWSSPIGVFRTTLAHGYIDGRPGHLQFYLSFGEEF